jgi:hypothetical protein
MQKGKVYNATLVKSGKKIQVYQHYHGGWVEWPSCSVKYHEDEVELDVIGTEEL